MPIGKKIFVRYSRLMTDAGKSDGRRGDPFIRDKFRWLDQIAADRRVSGSAFKAAYVIASAFLSREKGYAFPPQSLLAEKLHVSERQARTLVTELQRTGHLLIRRPGKKLPNEYHPIIHDRKDSSAHNGRVTGSFSSSDRKDSSGPYQPFEQPTEGGSFKEPPSQWMSSTSQNRNARRLADSEPGAFYDVGDEIETDSAGRCTVMEVHPSSIVVRSHETGEEHHLFIDAQGEVLPDDFDD